jgi:tetratricopeptide (TPR) repeat protein
MKDKAIEHYLTAIRIDPNYSDARFNLALIYISQGKMNLARNQLEEILRRDQRDIRARQFLDYIEKEQSR